MNSLVINFEDNGVGFADVGQAHSGLGLMSIEARAKALNGFFEYRNGAEKGVKHSLPIPNNKH